MRVPNNQHFEEASIATLDHSYTEL
jgi:S-ribosylhomocysteine lyase LuxS involved in autoinducer biosynthesis